MVLALSLTLIATLGGALASYLYDEDAPIGARLCAGACTGLAALGLLGFIFASLLGLALPAIALAAVAAATPFALLKNDNLRATVSADVLEALRRSRRAVLRPSWSAIGSFIFYALVAALLWTVFERALFELPDGVYTGVQNNYGDLPFHLSVITSFARGENFPPQDPTFAGVRFTYPFLSDFVAAMFVRGGASLRGAMFVENFVLALSLVGLLHRWTLLLVRDRLAAAIAPVLVLLSGGLGWARLLRHAREARVSLLDYLFQLPQRYTINGKALRWGNALTTLLVPQRGILFGLPLALVVFIIFRQMTRDAGDEQGVEDRDSLTRGRVEAGREKRKTKKGKKSHQATPPRDAALRLNASQRLSTSTRLSASTRSPASTRLNASTPPRIAVSPLPRMIAAGVIAGLLALVHAHTLMVVLLVGGLLAVLRDDWRAWVAGMGALALLAAGLWYLAPGSGATVPLAAAATSTPFVVKAYIVCAVVVLAGGALVWLLRGPRWREWLAFLSVAICISAPQLWWATRGSSVEATSFIGWHFGWDRGEESVWLFWFKNTGLFIPLLLAALLWRRGKPLVERGLLFYYLPFTLCFIIPNIVLVAPWVWDNIKVLFYWYVASVPLVALLLARLWRGGGALLRGAMIALLLSLTLAGALDVWSVVASRAVKLEEFDRDGISFAEALERQTRPRALIMHAPTFNHPVFLTGRQSLMGYPGHIWTHGLRYQEREALIKRIYAGGIDAAGLLSSAGVEYVVVSPLERQLMWVNDAFFAQYPLVVEAGDYQLYKIR